MLIRQAVAATLAYYGEPPDLGMVSFIDEKKVRPIKVRGVKTWGWTWLKAGFRVSGRTKGGLLAVQMLPSDMPEPCSALSRSMHGAPLWDAAQ